MSRQHLPPPRRLRGLGLLIGLGIGLAYPFLTPVYAQNNTATSSNINALLDRGNYWFVRFRYDLASQAFNKVLLINPQQPEALKWKGLIDLKSGDIEPSKIWLEQLHQILGPKHPQTLELAQALSMAYTNRQRVAEIRFRANRGDPSKQWLPALEGLFTNQPFGGAAVFYYNLIATQGEQEKQQARKEVARLIKRFPRDKRYSKLFTDLGGNLANIDDVLAAPATQVSQAPGSQPPSAPPGPNPFEKGTALSEEADKLIATGEIEQAIKKLVKAVDLLPDYAWFRYKLATTLDDQDNEASRALAEQIMAEGLELTPDNADMQQASNLFLSRREINDPFAEGTELAEKAEALIEQDKVQEAISAYEKAVDLNPDYPWFRFDLANLLDDQDTPESRAKAEQVMAQGRKRAPDDPSMSFASTLLAARQDRAAEALDLLAQVPKTQWTLAMTNTDNRLRYQIYLAELNTFEQNDQWNALGDHLAQNKKFNTEPEVVELTEQLRQRASPTFRMSRTQNVIDGDPGVSNINAEQWALELDYPIDLESSLFFRGDRVRYNAGDYATTVDYGNLVNFGSLATNTRASLQAGQADTSLLPAGFLQFNEQDFSGHLLGVGWRNDTWRVDVGKPVGNFPVDSWIGGLQWGTNVDDVTYRLDVGRRMINGSALSAVGAIDPGTRTTWGGARRNGLTGLVFKPLPLDSAFIGIGRLNWITGKAIPTNRETNLQLIYSRTLYAQDNQVVELGASAFFWKFQRNMRLYTLGQGGYYSPQKFRSFSIPLTWTGQHKKWSWQVQGNVSRSSSREDPTLLFPGNSALQADVLAAGNSIVDNGGPGGGSSFGLFIAIENQISPDLVVGARAGIDRSEGFNPDTLSVYMNYSFDSSIPLNTPPEEVSPYSEF